MITIEKIASNEILQYTAIDKNAMEIEKCNLSLDGILKKNKTIDLNKNKIDGRYWLNANKLFEYLVLCKEFIVKGERKDDEK